MDLNQLHVDNNQEIWALPHSMTGSIHTPSVNMNLEGQDMGVRSLQCNAKLAGLTSDKRKLV